MERIRIVEIYMTSSIITFYTDVKKMCIFTDKEFDYVLNILLCLVVLLETKSCDKIKKQHLLYFRIIKFDSILK